MLQLLLRSNNGYETKHCLHELTTPSRQMLTCTVLGAASFFSAISLQLVAREC